MKCYDRHFPWVHNLQGSIWENTTLLKFTIHYGSKYTVRTVYYMEVDEQKNANWDTALVLEHMWPSVTRAKIFSTSLIVQWKVLEFQIFAWTLAHLKLK